MSSLPGGLEPAGDVDPANTFVAEQVDVQSIVGLTIGEDPGALVLLTLNGRWNRGAADQLQVITSPMVARELAPLLLEASAGAENDLAAYLAGGDGA